VDWAYNTLPQKIKDLPDFPGNSETLLASRAIWWNSSYAA